jgi:hypothetical protein
MDAARFVSRLRGIHDRVRRARDATGSGERLYHFKDAKDSLATAHGNISALSVLEIGTAQRVSTHLDDAADQLDRFYTEYDEAKKQEHLLAAMARVSEAARAILAAGHANKSAWEAVSHVPQSPARRVFQQPRGPRFAARFPAELSALADRLGSLGPPPQPKRARPDPVDGPNSGAEPIDHVETTAAAAPAIVSVPTSVSLELQQATARVVDLAGMRFLREHPRPALSTVATSLVVTAGLVASASSAPRSTSERMRVAYLRGALSDESDPVRRRRLSDRPVFASSLQLGCREHDMALQILRGISETPELCDVTLLSAALDGAAGALTKYAHVDLNTALKMYTSAFDLFQGHGIESLKHWSFDRIVLARITALICKLRENSYRRDDPPSPPTADAVATHAPLDMGAGATQP